MCKTLQDLVSWSTLSDRLNDKILRSFADHYYAVFYAFKIQNAWYIEPWMLISLQCLRKSCCWLIWCLKYIRTSVRKPLYFDWVLKCNHLKLAYTVYWIEYFYLNCTVLRVVHLQCAMYLRTVTRVHVVCYFPPLLTILSVLVAFPLGWCLSKDQSSLWVQMNCSITSITRLLSLKGNFFKQHKKIYNTLLVFGINN